MPQRALLKVDDFCPLESPEADSVVKNDDGPQPCHFKLLASVKPEARALVARAAQVQVHERLGSISEWQCNIN